MALTLDRARLHFEPGVPSISSSSSPIHV
jgi:hypothetical protein